ncbi:hypothetical protein EPO34_00270 [Patescibacteria group bacterium]|nr:MAG: hypothetical protein EPO34_00270 [Patescibacteria group bacterium]
MPKKNSKMTSGFGILTEMPDPAHETRLAIRKADWNRLKKGVATICEEGWFDVRIRDIGVGALVGGLTMLITGPREWGAALVAASVLILWADSIRHKGRKSICQHLHEDMVSVEETFQK